MQVILDEYGRLCIVIICAAMFFSIFGKLVSTGDGGIRYYYNTDIVDVGVFESGDIGGRDMTHAIDGGARITYAPHFHPLNGIEDHADGSGKNYMNMYKIEGDTFSYEEAMKIFEPITAGVKTGIWMDDAETVPYTEDPTIIFTRYDVAITDHDEDGNELANPVIEYEDVVATDKYGNTKDPDGNQYGTHRQVKYTQTFEGELKRGDPPINIGDYTHLNMPPRFKVTYRIEVGNKKAEFQTMFIKDNYQVR